MMPKTLQPSKGPTDILECFLYAPWNPYNPLLGDFQTPGLCCLESTWVATAPCFSTNLLTKESSPSNLFRTTRSPNFRSSGISPGNHMMASPYLLVKFLQALWVSHVAVALSGYAVHLYTMWDTPTSLCPPSPQRHRVA